MALKWNDSGLHELKLSSEFWNFRCGPILSKINREFERDFDSDNFDAYSKHTFFPKLAESYDLRLLGAVIADKFGLPGYRSRSTQIALRFPGGNNVPWHIDGVSTGGNMVNPTHPFRFDATIGLYLSDVNEDCAPLNVKLGSHKVVENFGLEKGFSLLGKGVLPPEVKDMKSKAIVGSKGMAFLMHPHLVHSVPMNLSPYIRYALYWRIFN